jgi:hypothetical protein
VAALLLDAVLTGAKGINLWSSFRVPPPQRRARLYRTLVERGLASSVFGAMLPTEEPFLYTVSVTATEGASLDAVEHALFDPQPKRRYMVVPDQHEGEITIRKQIAQLVQLNEGQPYTYDRDALVKMLDEALAGSWPKTP